MVERQIEAPSDADIDAIARAWLRADAVSRDVLGIALDGSSADLVRLQQILDSMVIDGETGGLLFADNFKDFREFERARVGPLVGMYENLNALENRIIGIFSRRWLRTSRSMFAF